MLPALDAGDGQHLVDQREQMAPGLENVPDAFLLPAWPGRVISSNWPKPRMALSGVRSSWLMRERNSLLARLAFSASSFACCRPRPPAAAR